MTDGNNPINLFNAGQALIGANADKTIKSENILEY